MRNTIHQTITDLMKRVEFMKTITKKARKIILSVFCILIAAVLIIAGVLFFPLNGKEHTQIWSVSDEFDISSIQTVEKSADKEFKIMLVTDIQLWTNPVDNNKAYEQVKALVEKTNPDLIVTLGDNVSGVTARFDLPKFIKLMDSFKILWAPVFGNHDNEIPMNSLNWQGDKYEESEYCLFKKGPSNLYGCGNYVVNITENGKPIQSLYLFDNGRYNEYDDGSTKEIYMGYEQITWYEWNVNGINESAGNIVPSMTFSHFAQPEMREAVEKYGVKNDDESYTIPVEYGYGKCTYLPGTAPVKSGFLDKCKELGSTKYVFCGHDHENDASITVDGITYTYGLKTGPSPAPWNFAEHTGATVVTIGNAENNYAVSMENVVME